MAASASSPLVLALDVGTSGVRALLVDESGVPVARAHRETLPVCPGPGLVEHDLEALDAALFDVLGAALGQVAAGRVRAVGLSAQRATAVVWDSATGAPAARALSWQDMRTTERCAALMSEGLYVNPLMAASKIEWLLDRVDPERSGLRAGRLACGTLDSWLAWRLTGGRARVTDASHASCSGLWDFVRRDWSASVTEALRIPLASLPAIVDSSAVLAPLDGSRGLPPVPLAAVVGDQQAAMMGQLRLVPGEVKISYGTAAMLDMNAGADLVLSSRGAYPLVLWRRDGVLSYCLEGSAITVGAALVWLRDGLGVLGDPSDADAVAGSVPDAGGAWAVPAFQGLGTPYLDASARAVLGGLTRATTRAHVVRAVLEGIAWRCREVYDALRADSPHAEPRTLRADGGVARSNVLLQAQADALGLPVERPAVIEASALGAAYLAGLATGVWGGTDELAAAWRRDRVFEPRLDVDERETRFAAWQAHVPAARGAGA